MIEEKEVLQLIWDWRQAEEVLKLAKAKEIALRDMVFKTCFPEPEEGANTVDLPDKWKLTGTYKLNRTVDDAGFQAIKEQLRKIDVNPDPLVKYKPELSIKDYKALSEASRLVFDQCLVTKPGTPALELKEPKK